MDIESLLEVLAPLHQGDDVRLDFFAGASLEALLQLQRLIDSERLGVSDYIEHLITQVIDKGDWPIARECRCLEVYVGPQFNAGIVAAFLGVNDALEGAKVTHARRVVVPSASSEKVSRPSVALDLVRLRWVRSLGFVKLHLAGMLGVSPTCLYTWLKKPEDQASIHHPNAPARLDVIHTTSRILIQGGVKPPDVVWWWGRRRRDLGDNSPSCALEEGLVEELTERLMAAAHASVRKN